MGNELRIVLVEPNGSGGLIHYTYQLCTALAKEGIDVTLITGKNYELAELPHNFHVNNMLDLWTLFETRSLRSEVGNVWKRIWQKFHWTVRRGIRALRLIRAWVQLTRYLTALRPDLIQFSKINFPFESFFLARLQKNGLTLTQICHEFELRESTGVFSGLILRAYSNIYTHFSALFFHARENRDRFLKLFPFVPQERTHIIAHGNSDWLLRINSDPPSVLRDHYNLSDDEFVILFFGLLAPSKGLDDLVDAFALVHSSCNARLLIVGYPTKHISMDDLRMRISTLGLQNHVIVDARYIPLNQVRPLMELATLVVYPYVSSTQSGALQVAYTFGKPVIATNVGGLPEAVDDSKSGFLVPVHSPRDLADKIIIMINNPDLVTQMGAYARHLSETRFDWQTIARQLYKVYESLLNSKSGLTPGDND